MAASMAFVACKDDDETSFGDWNANAGYADVYFPTDKQTKELDPADPTTVTIQIARRNTKDSLTMSLIQNINTDSVFNVSDAVFAAGDSIAIITVNFPNAEVGKTYNLELTVSDPRYTSFYSDSLLYTLKVTRVKWVPAGFMTVTAEDLAWASSGYEENTTRPLMVEDETGTPVPITNYNVGDTIRGWVHYTEDFITSIFSVSNQIYPVKFQQREDQPHLYRLVNPYGENYLYNDPGDWDTSKDYYFIYDLSDPNAVIMQYDSNNCEMGLVWSYGAFILRSLSATKNDQYVGKYENGSITFPAGSFYIGMTGYNGGAFSWYSNNSGKFSIVVDPSRFKYVISLKDYDWEELFEGVFTSEQRGTSENATLYKGVCNVTDKDADWAFVENYGTPYRIQSPYSEDYDLIFTVKDGKFYLPEGYRIQQIGLDDNLGNDIYAKINTPECIFSDSEIKLNITFVNEDESIEYGTATESIANITWTEVGTATYYYASEDEDGNPVYEEDPGYPVLRRDDQPNVYKLEEWYQGGTFNFTWDPTNNKVSVLTSYTGFDHPTYGSMYVCDIDNYPHSDYFGYTSDEDPTYYDADKSTFYFGLVYFVEQGSFGISNEYMTVDWNVANVKAPFKGKQHNRTLPKFFQFKKANGTTWVWNGKKVQRKASLTLRETTL